MAPRTKKELPKLTMKLTQKNPNLSSHSIIEEVKKDAVHRDSNSNSLNKKNKVKRLNDNNKSVKKHKIDEQDSNNIAPESTKKKTPLHSHRRSRPPTNSIQPVQLKPFSIHLKKLEDDENKEVKRYLALSERKKAKAVVSETNSGRINVENNAQDKAVIDYKTLMIQLQYLETLITENLEVKKCCCCCRHVI